jgi:hypothetical protein
MTYFYLHVSCHQINKQMQVISITVFNFIGGFISGSFYAPYKKTMYREWKSFWITLFVSLIAILFFSTSVSSQDVYKEMRSGWLQKAELTQPKLIESIRHPVSLVSLVKDESVFQHWKAVKSDPVDTLYSKSFKNSLVL